MKTFVLREKEIAYYKKYAKSKGFTHAKLELEAQFNRCGDYEDSYDTCHECEGDGYHYCEICGGNDEITCDTCGGSNVFETDDGVEVDCADCEMAGYDYCDACDEGRITCDYCDGEGQVREETDWSLDSCEDYIMNRVSTNARQALEYIRTYNDGSVDTEVTLTLPIDNIEYMVEFIGAFKELGDEIGNGIDVDNAGMHMSFLTTGTYPCTKPLDEKKLNNFTVQVTKLLPVLYFLGTPNGSTRRMHFRIPKISSDKYNSYPAICTKDNAIEYRLFDTCYDTPEMVLDNFIVMARSLYFYDDELLPIKTKVTGDIGITEVQSIKDMFYTSKHIDVLTDGLRYLRPTYKTLKQLFDERDFTVTKSELANQRKQLAEEARASYKNKVAEYKFKRKASYYRGCYYYFSNVADIGEQNARQRYGTMHKFATDYMNDSSTPIQSLSEHIKNYISRRLNRDIVSTIYY